MIEALNLELGWEGDNSCVKPFTINFFAGSLVEQKLCGVWGFFGVVCFVSLFFVCLDFFFS